mgnify:CR=1 FL=1
MGRDSATFGHKGTEVPHCPMTKGQRDKLKILPRDGKGRDSLSKSGMQEETVRDFDCLSHPVP